MIKHIPTGLGHPYRTEPFERTPHFPTIGSEVTLRVCVEPQVTAVTAHITIDGLTKTQEMTNQGTAVARDLGEYGQPDKEIFSNTHLEDAAARSGEYGHWDSWSTDITIGTSTVTYFFTTDL